MDDPTSFVDDEISSRDFLLLSFLLMAAFFSFARIIVVILEEIHLNRFFLERKSKPLHLHHLHPEKCFQKIHRLVEHNSKTFTSSRDHFLLRHLRPPLLQLLRLHRQMLDVSLLFLFAH